MVRARLQRSSDCWAGHGGHLACKDNKQSDFHEKFEKDLRLAM